MLPDSNQQSNTSSTRRSSPLPCLLGIVILSILSLWISSNFPSYPLNSFSSCILPTHTASLRSWLTQIGSGVPQYLFRDTAQSLEFAIQFAKRFSLSNDGTQCEPSIFSSIFGIMSGILTNHEGTAR